MRLLRGKHCLRCFMAHIPYFSAPTADGSSRREREKIVGIENGIVDDDDNNNSNNCRIRRGGSAVDVSVSRRPIIFDRSMLVCFQSVT